MSAKTKHKPITVEDLELSEEELEQLFAGARQLFGEKEEKPKPKKRGDLKPFRLP